MRITKKWLSETKSAIHYQLMQLAKMDDQQIKNELKRLWPSYNEANDHETTTHHRMAICIDLALDRAFRPVID